MDPLLKYILDINVCNLISKYAEFGINEILFMMNNSIKNNGVRYHCLYSTYIYITTKCNLIILICEYYGNLYGFIIKKIIIRDQIEKYIKQLNENKLEILITDCYIEEQKIYIDNNNIIDYIFDLITKSWCNIIKYKIVLMYSHYELYVKYKISLFFNKLIYSKNNPKLYPIKQCCIKYKNTTTSMIPVYKKLATINYKFSKIISKKIKCCIVIINENTDGEYVLLACIYES
jgi:hypothetical protein